MSGAVGDIPFHDVFDMDEIPRPDLPDGPIIVAVAQNEMLRIPDYLRHHRAIGIRHFLIVDNASIDETAAYLDAQPDVTRLFSRRSFPVFKPIFRPWLADTWGVGRWVLAPDFDEHLVYPGWPEVGLQRLLVHWQARGYDGVFAPMVDMYADRPLDEVSHDRDARLCDVYPMFDAEGYWIAPPRRRTLASVPTPRSLLFGGARTRVSRGGGTREKIEDALIHRLMDWRNPKHPRPGAWLLHEWLVRTRGRPIGTKSKIPLIRWQRGIRFPGSNHRVQARLSLAPDWIALLHFRLMVDYDVREPAWDVRKGRETRPDAYAAVKQADLVWSGSRRFGGWRDLEAAGLIRASAELAPLVE